MNTIYFLVAYSLASFLVDLYLYLRLRTLFRRSARPRTVFTILWWSVPVIIITLFLLYSSMPRGWQILTRNAMVIIFFSKLIATLVMLVTEGVSALRGFFSKKENAPSSGLSRRQFVARVGAVTAFVPFFTMGYGIKAASDFRIHRVKLAFPNLPKAFSGFRIVQVSDIHTGSWVRTSAMNDAIDIILAQKPDIIVFTGDLVNSRTDEAFPFINMLSRLNAPHGVYSVLGNHDYGDYEKWPDEISQKANFDAMLDLHRRLNWDLLRNEHRVLEKNGEQIVLLGVENWGHSKRFPKYGKIDAAYSGVENIPFKVLLSHDPSHWDAQVTPSYGDIDLTLSGHTHGFQFGIEIPGFRWSPSQWIYKHWAGLYQRGAQYLYVNRGTGCLGYSGRIGIRPEITVIELNA